MRAVIRQFKALLLAAAATLVATFSSHPVQNSHPARSFELRAESPQFWKIVSREAKLEVVSTGFGFTEGPVWDPAGFLYVSDEEQNKIFRVYMDGRQEEVIALGDPDGNTYDLKHQLLDCASLLRAIIRVEPGGHYTILADRYDGKRFNSPNDVVIGPDGAIYFTDPTLDLLAGEKQDIPFQGVYRVDAKGDVRLLTKELTQPNGLAFSPDGKKFYVDDSEQKNIRVYDFLADGTLNRGRIFGSEDTGKKGGVPDGMKVDVEGRVYCTGPGGIHVIDPGGNLLGRLRVPGHCTNLAWGDDDWRSLYFTTYHGVHRTRLNIPGVAVW